MKRFACMLFSVIFICMLCFPALAAWPEECSIQAESGILMDADSSAVLYGKNIHNAYYPASITKILTALVVLENSPDLSEIVTFSSNAVYNVEEGSSNAGLSPGDQLSIQDCLYALLLKSANEAANALAEHIAGSIPRFVDMMNAKAEQLGCVDSHFANPSGLNDPEHYTSAYDMALIAKAAFSNPTLTEIASSTYYDLPPLKQYPEGQTVYIGHKMLKKNFSSYYPYAVAGKTGYTSLAGNTLVTYAEKDGMRLVAVILKGNNPYHYSDTKTLFDYGFQNFKTLNITEYETAYTSLESDLSIAGVTTAKPLLTLNSDSYITVPKTVGFDEVSSSLSYQLTLPYPSTAVAELNYSYENHFVGRAYLEIDASMLDSEQSAVAAQPETLAADQLPTLEAEEIQKDNRSVDVEEEESSLGSPITDAAMQRTESRQQRLLPLIRLAVLLVVVLGVGAFFYFLQKSRQQKQLREKEMRERKRKERLFEAGYTTREFQRLLEKKRKEKEEQSPK